MSVVRLDRLPLDEQVMRVAAAAVIMGRKGSPQAVRRCRRRLTRAIKALNDEVQPLQGPYARPALREGAAEWLRMGCAACGRCEGV
jgi:hypothetical protein